ncbi:MAG: HIT family protein [archaeon]
MSDCIFCKIVKGEIPSFKVYEDDKFLAFLDINPVNFGHTLIVPKKHSIDILDTSEEILGNWIKLAKKLSKAIKNATNADAFELAINNGEASGQIVPHLHLHIMPRFFKDGLKYNWPTKKYKEGKDKEIAEKIRKELKD